MANAAPEPDDRFKHFTVIDTTDVPPRTRKRGRKPGPSTRSRTQAEALCLFIIDSDEEGATVGEMCAYLSLPSHKVRRLVRLVRHQYADRDMNLICSRQGHRAPWRYRFVGTLTEARPYIEGRKAVVEGHIRTAIDVLQPILTGADSDTPETIRWGRRVNRLLTRTLEDFSDED